ncbi:hypothetical protein B0J13DRAFT_312562 [Dactylonectria estremocensis]|uniref:Uncharacterized protein n=1 Tax=Dactylonectria estremocensis TaxID=1079267 RepID=A0A9P9EXK4_9HYPO|nr:hypothetical protein B0J13DRAFT_312562 [Dactylonectria estremocensis]
MELLPRCSSVPAASHISTPHTFRQQVRARRYLPLRQQPRVVCHGPPTHQPASHLITDRCPNVPGSQGVPELTAVPELPAFLELTLPSHSSLPLGRGTRGDLPGWQSGRGGLPATSQGPLVSSKRTNPLRLIVRTARPSAGVAVRNRMTWDVKQYLCAQGLVAHPEQDGDGQRLIDCVISPCRNSYACVVSQSRPELWVGTASGGSVRFGRLSGRVVSEA